MKRILILILAVVMVFTIVACDSSDLPSETEASTTEENLTAQEKLTEQEKKLFDMLIKMTTDDFYEPSAVRVLQIGDHINDTINDFDYDTLEFLDGESREIIVVKLQGENKVGGTLNHCYKISLTTHRDNSPIGEMTISSYTSFILSSAMSALVGGTSVSDETYRKRKAEVMDYEAEAGDYVQLSDNYAIEEDASDEFNIGNINRALTEYWEELGF